MNASDAQTGDPSPSKEDFCRFCRLLYDRRLTTGVGGNVAVRRADRIWLTPTGVSLRDLHEEQIAVVDVQGAPLYGPRPTQEADMHLGILRARPDVNAVCHLHGAHIIAASTFLEPGSCSLPPLTPGFIYYAFPLPMLPFRTPGTMELAKDVADALSARGASAILLQNHGLVTVGTDLREALDIAEEIDEAAHVYVLAGGKAASIPEKDIRAITSMRKG